MKIIIKKNKKKKFNDVVIKDDDVDFNYKRVLLVGMFFLLFVSSLLVNAFVLFYDTSVVIPSNDGVSRVGFVGNTSIINCSERFYEGVTINSTHCGYVEILE